MGWYDSLSPQQRKTPCAHCCFCPGSHRGRLCPTHRKGEVVSRFSENRFSPILEYKAARSPWYKGGYMIDFYSNLTRIQQVEIPCVTCGQSASRHRCLDGTCTIGYRIRWYEPIEK